MAGIRVKIGDQVMDNSASARYSITDGNDTARFINFQHFVIALDLLFDQLTDFFRL